jgi:hypothetical protein
MAASSHVVTLRADLPHAVIDALLTAIEAALMEAGAVRVWIDTSVRRDITVVAELPGLGHQHS